MKHAIRLILTFDTDAPLTERDLRVRAVRAAECVHEHINEDTDENILPGNECQFSAASEGGALYAEIMEAKADHERRITEKSTFSKLTDAQIAARAAYYHMSVPEFLEWRGRSGNHEQGDIR